MLHLQSTFYAVISSPYCREALSDTQELKKDTAILALEIQGLKQQMKQDKEDAERQAKTLHAQLAEVLQILHSKH
jgi:hypothetical protein